ncbi:TRAP transporter substrate-binding protein DctP [Pacificoceanicola onchidii]|uniref:TRAP transporter substrate-binding protein DctP n=1 Tax=Pacificoceanicola onchidii TaxID=2562685 RepID=UPI0010A630DF|nr:TRAP transporter substrate-binding protein DctP [Pacificoceanicola onchidii]
MISMKKAFAALAVAATTTAGAATAADYNLTFHAAFGEAGLNESARVWMDEVEERTDGRVKFTRLFGGALGKFSGQPTGLKARSFDVGQVSSVYNPGLYPRATLGILPFLSDDVLEHNKIMHDFYSSDDFKQEFDALNQKFMFNGTWIWMQMMSYDEVKTIEDLGEIKIRAHGGSADALTAAGITSYAIPFGELPAAAEKKVVEAVTMGGPSDMVDFGFGDIFPYWYEGLDWYYMPMTLVINKDAWAELPEDIQKIIEDLNAEMVERSMELMLAQQEAAAQTLTGELGVKSVSFNDVDKLVAAGEASWATWVEGMKESGVDGQALLDAYKAMADEQG